MDSSDDKDTTGEKSFDRVDVLARQVEVYRIMVEVFYRYLDKFDKIYALTEAAERIKKEVSNE